MSRPIAACFVWMCLTAMAGAQPRIIRHDARFDALIPRDTKVEKLAEGFAWVEGPVWSRQLSALLFSDIPRNSVFQWRESAGASVFLKSSGYTGREPFPGREPGSNGLAFDLLGRLVLAEHGDRRVSRLEPDGSKTTLADRYQGKRLNTPNDVLFAANGDLYFTDPPFGLPGGAQDPGRELNFSGMYRLTNDGTLTLLTRELPFPNGIALSPDEKLLYLTNADPDKPEWYVFPILPGGHLGAGRLFFSGIELRTYGPGSADGMKVDRAGNLFAAGPGGIHVFAPDGTLLGSVIIGVATGNCAWGGDGSDLYITADTSIYRIRTATKGSRF